MLKAGMMFSTRVFKGATVSLWITVSCVWFGSFAGDNG